MGKNGEIISKKTEMAKKQKEKNLREKKMKKKV